MKKNILVYLLLLCSISIFAQGVVTPPRTCSVCKKTKPASDFSGDSKICKACAQKKPERRTCSSCKKPKALNEFSGSSKICRECAKPITITSGEYVDLGLPSGTLWATCNVGANSPEEYGDYFAWGETIGYYGGKHNFTWENYTWGNSQYGTVLKYNCGSVHQQEKKEIDLTGDTIFINWYGIVDNKSELDFEDDAAYVNCGNHWRMPSKEQFEELLAKCVWKWTTYKGITGYFVKGKNGNAIFFPAIGGSYFTSYSTRSLTIGWPSDVFILNIGVGKHILSEHGDRYRAYRVRPVLRLTPQEVERENIKRKQAEKEYLLGNDYYYGRNGKPKDYSEAIKLYRKAADNGSAEAQYLIGHKYDIGDGFEKDETKAAMWYRKAAGQGNADAQAWLSDYYIEGKGGVKKNYKKALELIRKSVSHGNIYAQNNLGYMYCGGYGVTKDYNEAIMWFRKSIEGGDNNAKVNLGYMYENGFGVKADYIEALKLYREAAEHGETSGMLALGNYYFLSNNYSEALTWYGKAAEHGDAKGQTSLGCLYENGWGVAKDYSEAIRWYRKSAKQGDAVGQYSLGSMYYLGSGVTKDYNEAVKWYRKAAEQGDGMGQFLLASMYEKGEGVVKDLAQAAYWYKKSLNDETTKSVAKNALNKLAILEQEEKDLRETLK